MSAGGSRRIELDSPTSGGLRWVMLGLVVVVAGGAAFAYVRGALAVAVSATALAVGSSCALFLLRSAPTRLVVDAERVTLEDGGGNTVAQVSRAEALATPGVFFHSAFWSDSVIESDSPMLALDLDGREVTIMLRGGVSGWPRGPIVKRRPRHRVNEEDFLWLAEALCARESIAEVDFSERMSNPV